MAAMAAMSTLAALALLASPLRSSSPAAALRCTDVVALLRRRQLTDALTAIPVATLATALPTFAALPSPEQTTAALAEDRSASVIAGGTALSLRSVDAAAAGGALGPMALYPDPLLRRTASAVTTFGPSLELVAQQLVSGMQSNAITALQYAVDARIIALRGPATPSGRPLVLVNPSILERSSEQRMVSWREICLVLPPDLEIDLLRDEWVRVAAQDIHGTPFTVTLRGEAARAFEHELDHLNGILIIDHAGLDELPQGIARLEAPYHDARQRRAYTRTLPAPSDVPAASPLPLAAAPSAARVLPHVGGGGLLPGMFAVGGFGALKAINQAGRERRT